MMDGIDTQALKKYWPYAVGVLGAAFLYTKLKGGNTAPQSVSIGAAVDPAILQANNQLAGQMAAIQGQVATAQIQGQTQTDVATMAAVAQGFDTISNVTNSTIQGNIASYNAVKDISVNAVNSSAALTSNAITAAGESTATFGNAVGNLGIATGQIVQGASKSNDALFGNLGRVAIAGIQMGGF